MSKPTAKQNKDKKKAAIEKEKPLARARQDAINRRTKAGKE